MEKLTECEQLVMKTVWDADEELGLMEIMKRVNDKYHKEWRPQTVSTFLARLVGKGYLEHYRQGRVFFYRILIPLEEYRAQIAKEFDEFWFRDSDVSVRQEARAALETLIKICESQEKCVVCPLYDPDGADTACMLINTVRDSFADNARAALEYIEKVSISQ